MATVTLGNIKFNWKGAWNSATAYVVDDVVSLSGSSYVCIQAGTNQNPSTATAYWEQMSSAGTDLTTTLTTQGDLVYRDGSGLQRLGAGTSGQALITGGTGANPSWGSAGGVVQVKQGVKTDVQSWANGSNVMIGAVASITPTNANNKILICTSGSLGSSTSTTQSIAMRFQTGGAVSNSSSFVDAIGDAAGSRSRAMFSGSANPHGTSTWFGTNFSYQYLHAPSTTSAIQYQLCAIAYDSGVTHYLGKSDRDSDDATHWRTPHTIVLMEIDSGVL